jgi:hypothetical protein
MTTAQPTSPRGTNHSHFPSGFPVVNIVGRQPPGIVRFEATDRPLGPLPSGTLFWSGMAYILALSIRTQAD